VHRSCQCVAAAEIRANAPSEAVKKSLTSRIDRRKRLSHIGTHSLRFCGAGAFACQPNISQLLTVAALKASEKTGLAVIERLGAIFIGAPVFNRLFDVGRLHAILRRSLTQRNEFSVGRKTERHDLAHAQTWVQKLAGHDKVA